VSGDSAVDVKPSMSLKIAPEACPECERGLLGERCSDDCGTCCGYAAEC
jgi:hypothetical protein